MHDNRHVSPAQVCRSCGNVALGLIVQDMHSVGQRSPRWAELPVARDRRLSRAPRQVTAE